MQQFKDPHPQSPYEVLLKEQRENERVTALRKKMRMQKLDLTENDLLGYSPSRQPANQIAQAILTEDDMYGGLSAEDAAAIRSSQPLFEDDPMRYSTQSSIVDSYGAPIQRRQPLVERMPEKQPMRNPTWSAKKLRAKLTNGEIVPVWKVTDSQSGIEMPTNFRIVEFAERVADILNETGNINDARVVSTTGAYNKRVKLLKEMKQAKLNAQEGDISAKKRVSILKEEIAAIDYRFGI